MVQCVKVIYVYLWVEQRSVPLWSAYFCFRSPQWHFFFLLSGVTVGFALAACSPKPLPTLPSLKVPDGYKWWTFWTSRSSKAWRELHVYIYIYVCVCEDGFNLQIKHIWRGVRIDSPNVIHGVHKKTSVQTVFKCPHLETGLTKSKHFHPSFSEPLKVPTSPRHTHQWYLLNLNAGNDKTTVKGSRAEGSGLDYSWGFVPVIHSPLGYVLDVLIQGCLYKANEVFNINDPLVQGIGNDLD